MYGKHMAYNVARALRVNQAGIDGVHADSRSMYSKAALSVSPTTPCLEAM